MAGESEGDRRAAANRRALELITEALDLLDAHGGSAEAAAYLELAREKLFNTKAD